MKNNRKKKKKIVDTVKEEVERLEKMRLARLKSEETFTEYQKRSRDLKMSTIRPRMIRHLSDGSDEDDVE